MPISKGRSKGRIEKKREGGGMRRREGATNNRAMAEGSTRWGG